MATEAGVVQGLWSECRLGGLARGEAVLRSLQRLASKGRAEKFLAGLKAAWEEEESNFAKALAWALEDLSPPGRPVPVEVGGAEPRALKEALWREAAERSIPRLVNARWLLDEPHLDRVWLFRGGRWVLYRWSNRGWRGTPLDEALSREATSDEARLDLLLDIRIGGSTHENPKLATASVASRPPVSYTPPLRP